MALTPELFLLYTQNYLSLVRRFVDNVPFELQSISAWTLWNYNNKGKKLPKTPKNELRSITNPEHDLTFDEVLCALKDGEFNGIGFVLQEKYGITGIDIDNCCSVAPDGSIIVSEEAKEIIELCNSYTEYSPSRKGIRIFIRGTFPNVKYKNLEIYSNKRFLTVTGNVLSDTTIKKVDISFLYKNKKYEESVSNEDLCNDIIVSIGKKLSLNELIVRANKMLSRLQKDKYGSQSEYDLAICSVLCFYCNCKATVRLAMLKYFYRDKFKKHPTYLDKQIELGMKSRYNFFNVRFSKLNDALKELILCKQYQNIRTGISDLVQVCRNRFKVLIEMVVRYLSFPGDEFFISHYELADKTGLHRETCGRHVKYLLDKGMFQVVTANTLYHSTVYLFLIVAVSLEIIKSLDLRFKKLKRGLALSELFEGIKNSLINKKYVLE